MQPLYDMLANAQNGAAFEQMARQFGLSQEQARALCGAIRASGGDCILR